MTSSPSILTKAVLTLAVAGSMAAVLSAPAAAQTARNLICNGCVDTRDIKTSAVKTNKIKNNAVTSAKIRNSAVGNAKIRNNAVTGGKIADGSVGNADLGNNAVTGGKIADGSVGNADLGNDAVTGGKIADGTVDTPDLASNAVTSGKIANGAVGNADLANDAVDSSKVAPNSLTAGDLAANSVTASEIASSAVGASEIASSAVRASEVASNSVPATDLSNEAGVDFSNGSSVGTSVNLSTAWTDLRTVAVTRPGTGFVTCIGTGHADWDLANFTGSIHIGWGTAAGNVAPPAYNRASLPTGADQTTYIPITQLHTFSVFGAGTTTYRFKGEISTGAATSIDFFVSSVACMFFPTRY